jgi:hypothetical protein
MTKDIIHLLIITELEVASWLGWRDSNFEGMGCIFCFDLRSCYTGYMGLFDDLLGKASELTGMGQDATDAAGQVTENVTSQVDEVTGQVQEQVTNVTENLPQDPQDIINHISGDSNKE